MRNVILLTQGPMAWHVRYKGPHVEEVIKLFDTDTLPTPFTPQASGDVVKRELERLNPGKVVILEPASPAMGHKATKKNKTMTTIHTHRCPICGAYQDCDDPWCIAGEGFECDEHVAG